MLIYNLHAKEESLNKYLDYTVKLDFEDETKNLKKKTSKRNKQSHLPDRAHIHMMIEEITASDIVFRMTHGP